MKTYLMTILLSLTLFGQGFSGNFYGIKILSGVENHQVFQRDTENKTTVSIEGIASPSNCSLEYRVLRRTQVLNDYPWSEVKLKQDGTWSTLIQNLPLGGPYQLEFHLLDKDHQEISRLDVFDILVGDLWFLGGQSNMDGCASLKDAESPSEMVHAFSLADEWQVAEEPLVWNSEAIDMVYRTSYVSPTKRSSVEYKRREDQPPPTFGAGLALPFAKEVTKITHVPIGLIVGSLGGSTMDQWSPVLRDQGEKSLYGSMMRRVGLIGGKIKGVLWWQGESDAYLASEYENKFKNFILTLRTDLHNPDLPFYTVQLCHGTLGTINSDMNGWMTVQEAQRKLMEELPHTGLVSTMDLSLISAHLDTPSYQRVGRRLAKEVLRDLYNQSQFQSGPQLENITLFDSLYGDGLRLTFRNVNGQLVAPPRVNGFSLRDKNGSDKGLYLINSELDPNHPNDILLHLGFKLKNKPEGVYLWYGYGANPFCNVVDKEDMALSMFGPKLITGEKKE